MAAFNACITVGYVAGAALKGIKLESLEIRTRGQLDLRGFLGLSDKVAPGYEKIDYEVAIKGDGSPEDFAEIHKTVMATSPNYFNMSRPIRMNGSLKLGLSSVPGAMHAPHSPAARDPTKGRKNDPVSH